MSSRPGILNDIEDALNDREVDLLADQERLLKFLASQHTAAENLKAQNDVLESQIINGGLLKGILANTDIAIEFRGEAAALAARARGLTTYTRDMFQLLANDLNQRQREEDKIAADLAKKKKTFTDYVMKVSTFVGLPTVLMGVADKLSGGKQVVMDVAIAAGVAVTGPYLVWDLKQDENVRMAVSGIPGLIKTAPRNIYYSGAAMDARISCILTFENSAGVVARRVSNTSKRLNQIVHKMGSKNSPKP